MNIALHVSMNQHEWRVRLFRDSDGLFVCLEPELEQHRLQIEEIVDKTTKHYWVKNITILILLSWFQYQDDTKKAQLNTLRMARERTLNAQAPIVADERPRIDDGAAAE